MKRKHFLFIFATFSWLSAAAISIADPAISITSPGDQAVWQFLSDTPITFTASTSDSSGLVIGVDWYFDGRRFDSSDVAPFSVQMTPEMIEIYTYEDERIPFVGSATHTITARATDSHGVTTLSSPIQVSFPPAGSFAIASASQVPDTYTCAIGVTATFIGDPQADSSWVWVEIAKYDPNNPGAPLSYSGTAEEMPLSDFIDSFYVFGIGDANTTYSVRIAGMTEGGFAYSQPVLVEVGLPIPNLIIYVSPSEGGSATLPPIIGNDYVAISDVGQGAFGSTSFTGNVVNYTPGPNFTSSDNFNLTITDGTISGISTVTVVNLRNLAAGSYSTTVTEPNTDGPAGAFNLTMTASGAFTGSLVLYGTQYPFTGRFSVDGITAFDIPRVGESPLSMKLSFDASSSPPVLSGYAMFDGNSRYYTIDPEAALAPVSASTALAGNYTLLLPASKTTTNPQGDGFAAGLLSAHGRLRLIGKSGTGSQISVGSRLRKDGSVLIATRTGANSRNRLTGNLAFAHPLNQNNDCDGVMGWYQAPSETGYYKEGFLASFQAIGSRFHGVNSGERTLSYNGESAEAGVRVTNFDGTTLATFPLNVESNDVGASAPGSSLPLTVKFNRKTGLFSGRANLGPGSGGSRWVGGAVLQRQNRAGGVISLKTRTGAVELTPE